MPNEEERRLQLEKQLEKYPAVGLDPTEVAEVLNISRRYVDTLMDEGKLNYFVLDPDMKRKQKRVTKDTLIAYILKNTNQ